MIGVIRISYESIQRRIRRRKLRFRIIVITMLICGAFVYLLANPVIQVKNIFVYGNNNVPADKLISMSEVNLGDNLLRLNVRRMKENIYADPHIETCKIRLLPLGNVYITVAERENAGYTVFENRYITFDKNAVAIESLDKHDEINLPLISGINIKNVTLGKVLEVADDRQIEVIKIVFDSITRNGLSDIINEVDIKNLVSIIIKTKPGVNIKLGTVENIDKKLATAKEIMEKDIIKKDLKGTLDISFNGNPVFRPE